MKSYFGTINGITITEEQANNVLRQIAVKKRDDEFKNRYVPQPGDFFTYEWHPASHIPNGSPKGVFVAANNSERVFIKFSGCAHNETLWAIGTDGFPTWFRLTDKDIVFIKLEGAFPADPNSKL